MGVSEDDFWRCTPIELDALLDKIAERDEARERAAALRAALIAAEVHNANRVDGRGRRIGYRKPVQPADYLRESQEVQYVSGETLRGLVHDWLRKGRN